MRKHNAQVVEDHVEIDERSRGILPASAIGQLIEVLAHRGYEVQGPTIRDGAIVYDHVDSLDDLPKGWTDEQEPGRYQLKQRQDGAFFGFAVGPQSLKKYFHSPEVRLFSAERQNDTFRILNNEALPNHQMAFLGVRACELEAVATQDRVLLRDKYLDPVYKERRTNVFVVAVQCTQASKTCFCASMGSGPRARAGFDLALTELVDEGGHRFIVEIGSEAGAQVLAELPSASATEADLQQGETMVANAAQQQIRSINTAVVKDLLLEHFEHPRWDVIANRCLSCANCTMVCPTCFCTTVTDVTDVTGEHAERWRYWDSCFTLAFSYIHGGSIRSSSKARYRQWMTHKLASWMDQFGRLGCVGCGRCITWCPVGIDITEEVRAIREGQSHGES